MESFLISKHDAFSICKSLASYLGLNSSDLSDQNFKEFITFRLNNLAKDKALELEVKFNEWVTNIGYGNFHLKSSVQITPNLSKDESEYLSKNTTSIDEKFNLLLNETLENLKSINTDDREHTLSITLHLYNCEK